MRGKKHNDETRAAVMAALLAGQGVMEVAEQYNLPESTVRNIRTSIPVNKLAEVRVKKAVDFDELLTNFLVETVTTLAVQAEHFRDRQWLAKQDADKLAVLHGVQTDKAIRLLEAAERAGFDSGKRPDVP